MTKQIITHLTEVQLLEINARLVQGKPLTASEANSLLAEVLLSRRLLVRFCNWIYQPGKSQEEHLSTLRNLVTEALEHLGQKPPEGAPEIPA